MHPFTAGAVRRAAVPACARALAAALKPTLPACTRSCLAAAAALLLLAFGLAAPAGAQQFVTDDAAIVDYRACQLEGWHGQTASWILPACQPLPNLELTAGVGFVANEGGRAAEYVLQAKTLFRELEPNGWGIGLVAGVGYDPLAQVRGGVAGAYAYIPASLSLADDRLILHGNLGWHYDRDEHEHNGVVHAEPHHAVAWGVRGDVMLTERFTAIGEFYGEDRFRPEYQLGLRTAAIPERLLIDVSYGGHTAAGVGGAGWVVGLAWTPPPFF